VKLFHLLLNPFADLVEEAVFAARYAFVLTQTCTEREREMAKVNA
jgi:hypothetical protein